MLIVLFGPPSHLQKILGLSQGAVGTFRGFQAETHQCRILCLLMSYGLLVLDIYFMDIRRKKMHPVSKFKMMILYLTVIKK